jgi:tRNA threonylcarbamoyladenosine biosynthesis protein TsaB
VSAIVGFDTATPATSVAVLVPDGAEVELRDDPAPGEPPRHAETLQPLLERALEHAGQSWGDVARICVGVGPGGFTGLRLGVATARALAQGRDLTLAGVSSLEALARGAELGLEDADAAHAQVLAVIDARRGEVFVAGYRGGRCTFSPAVMAPAALADSLAARPGAFMAVGDGAVRFRAELERAGVAVPADGSRAHRVSALMVCRLGRAREPADRDALLPDYRREPDATPPPFPQ